MGSPHGADPAPVVPEPVAEPVAESVAEPVAEPVAESVAEPEVPEVDEDDEDVPVARSAALIEEALNATASVKSSKF